MGGSGGKPDYGSVGRGFGATTGSGRDSGGSAGGDFDCLAFRTTTTLRSPKEDTLAGVKPGDHLLVALKDGAVIATNGAGDAVGSIVVPELEELIRCIEEGIEYRADVRSIGGGACVVEVFAR